MFRSYNRVRVNWGEPAPPKPATVSVAYYIERSGYVPTELVDPNPAIGLWTVRRILYSRNFKNELSGTILFSDTINFANRLRKAIRFAKDDMRENGWWGCPINIVGEDYEKHRKTGKGAGVK